MSTYSTARIVLRREESPPGESGGSLRNIMIEMAKIALSAITMPGSQEDDHT